MAQAQGRQQHCQRPTPLTQQTSPCCQQGPPQPRDNLSSVGSHLHHVTWICFVTSCSGKSKRWELERMGTHPYFRPWDIHLLAFLKPGGLRD